MNLVKQLMDQFSGNAMGELGSLLGTDAETAQRATGAAVPSLLSALAGMMSNDESDKRLTSVLGGLDTSSLGNIADILGGNTSSLLNKGSGLLGSLFGDGVVAGIANAVSRFTGLNVGIVKTLLAYLTPVVLGKVAVQWKSQGGSGQALESLFVDQRHNIADAVPAGFSLADIPGLADARKPVHVSGRAAPTLPVAAQSPVRWAVPVGLALVAGFLLWQFLARPKVDQTAGKKTAPTESAVMKPVLPAVIDVPDVAAVRNDVGSLVTALGTTFAGIPDAASADRAMPALKDLSAKVDAFDHVLSQLPQASVTALRPAIEEQVKVVAAKANAVSSMDGVSAEIKTLIQHIVTTITRWMSAENK